MLSKDKCVDCFRIVCKGCGWVPDAAQFKEMQAGSLTKCPTCGWKPGDPQPQNTSYNP